jgi:regulator of protease activity HflC (stomatin/prohibitin superfamily)
VNINWVQSIIEFLDRFWPLVKIEQWERGCYYILGRARKKVLRPGVYPVIPWFISVDSISVVPAPISSPLLNITLKDGRTLGFSITAIVRVRDPIKALNEIDDYKESASELISSRTAEKLAEVDGSRVETENRKRLLSDLLRWVNQDTDDYGIEVLALRFSNFALDQRAYRLLQDTALGSIAW